VACAPRRVTLSWLAAGPVGRAVRDLHFTAVDSEIATAVEALLARAPAITLEKRW
jgi:hypothetical protein